MSGSKGNELDRTIELLERILVFQLYALGVPQPRIAKITEKSAGWVNSLVKGIPRSGGRKD